MTDDEIRAKTLQADFEKLVEGECDIPLLVGFLDSLVHEIRFFRDKKAGDVRLPTRGFARAHLDAALHDLSNARDSIREAEGWLSGKFPKTEDHR